MVEQSACLASRELAAASAWAGGSLYIFLHECAHATLGHNGKVPRHVEEMEAEQWAHATMRKHGIAVPRSMTEQAKQYVARKIRQAVRRGAKRIDARAKAFAKSNGRSP
jgi:hypothetical protein